MPDPSSRYTVVHAAKRAFANVTTTKVANTSEYAIEYALLLQKRKSSFYNGVDLRRKVLEADNFKKSKSYKLYRFISLFNKIRGRGN